MKFQIRSLEKNLFEALLKISNCIIYSVNLKMLGRRPFDSSKPSYIEFNEYQRMNWSEFGR